jgi:ABC-2 type transport system permease protein
VVERPSAWLPYRALLASRVRSQTSYRTSFVLDVFGSFATGATEFAEVYIIFHNVPVFGGLDFGAAMLLFGLANLSFALADLMAGTLDQVPQLIRSGTLDVLLLRPLPLLPQLITGDVSLRRLGRATLAVGVLATGLTQVDIDWTPARVALLVVTPLAGAAIFAALFVGAGAVQFWLVEGGEFTYGFTYGSSYAASFSPAVMPFPLRVFFAFVVPAAFVGYLPTLTLLGRPGPAGLPAWLGWLVPAVAAVSWLAAASAWRLGVRHYTGAGG